MHCNPVQGQYRARTGFSLCSFSTQGKTPQGKPCFHYRDGFAVHVTNIIFNEKMTFLKIGGRSTRQDNKTKLQAYVATRSCTQPKNMHVCHIIRNGNKWYRIYTANKLAVQSTISCFLNVLSFTVGIQSIQGAAL